MGHFKNVKNIFDITIKKLKFLLKSLLIV